MKKGILSALVLTMALAPTAVGVNAHYDSTLKKPGIKTVLKETGDKQTSKAFIKVDTSKGYFEGWDDTVGQLENILESDLVLHYFPNVIAKEGYKHIGWVVKDNDDKVIGEIDPNVFEYAFSESGTYFIEALFEEVKAPVANAIVKVDPSKGYFEGYDGQSECTNNHLEESDYKLGFLPKVIAKSGYTFTGWSVKEKDNKVDPLFLDTFTTEIMFGPFEGNYIVEAVFEAVERTVEVSFSINSDQGYFTDPANAEVVTFKGVSADSTEQFLVPQVAAKEGYVFKGWKGQGAEVIEWDADTKTFGVTGLCFFPEGSTVGFASLEAVFEKVDTKKTANVYFNVDSEKGYFIDPKGAEVVSFENIDADSAQQFLVPKVEAKEGYVFKGWKGQGAEVIEWGADAETFGVTGLCHFAQGSNQGYATIEAVFEKVTPEKPVNPSKPDAKPENKPAKKPVTAWDNGGPFTTNAEGDVFDRWGNLIYDAPATSHSSNGYTMVNTSDR